VFSLCVEDAVIVEGRTQLLSCLLSIYAGQQLPMPCARPGLQQLLAEPLQHGLHGGNTVQQRSPPPFSNLPPELLVEVLRHVQLPLLLGPCSQVCSAWRAATAAATSAVNVVLDGYCRNDEWDEHVWEDEHIAEKAAEEVLASRDSVPCFQQWLAIHAGAAVTQLKVKADISKNEAARPALQLPMGQLQRLHSLTCCGVQLQEQPHRPKNSCTADVEHEQQQQQQQQQASQWQQKAPLTSSNLSAAAAELSLCNDNNSSTAVLQVSMPCLASLTALRLRHVSYRCLGGVAALSALTGLQELQLLCVQVQQAEKPLQQQQQQQQQGQLERGWLSPMTQLTRLHLDVELLPKGSSGVFDQLQHLQALILQGDSVASLDVLQRLPPSITKLELQDVQYIEPFGLSSVPALTQLPALQDIEVCEAVIVRKNWEPVLGGIQVGFLLGLPNPVKLRMLHLEGDICSDTVPLLLDFMPRLTSLVHLDITSIDRNDDNMPQPVRDVTRYSAMLPAAAQLTSIRLTCKHSVHAAGWLWVSHVRHRPAAAVPEAADTGCI
jgi:hypothetical protein